jgi:hypothetical protein
MVVKNVSLENIYINKSVQISTTTIDPNDGIVLPGQTLDLSKSMTLYDLMESEDLNKAINSGDLVMVTGGVPLNSIQSVSLYKSGSTEWAEVFDSEVSKDILYGGMVSGVLYVNKCFIG